MPEIILRYFPTKWAFLRSVVSLAVDVLAPGLIMLKTRAMAKHGVSVGDTAAMRLYARFFLFSSITIMATVCRFFPSQFIGVISAGSGASRQELYGKRGASLPLHPQRQTTFSIAYFAGMSFMHLTCSKPVSTYLEGGGPGKAWGTSLSANRMVTLTMVR